MAYACFFVIACQILGETESIHCFLARGSDLVRLAVGALFAVLCPVLLLLPAAFKMVFLFGVCNCTYLQRHNFKHDAWTFNSAVSDAHITRHANIQSEDTCNERVFGHVVAVVV